MGYSLVTKGTMAQALPAPASAAVRGHSQLHVEVYNIAHVAVGPIFDNRARALLIP